MTLSQHEAPLLSPFSVPALIAGHKYSSLRTSEGELHVFDNATLRSYLKEHPAPLLIHGPNTAKILNLPEEKQPYPWFDILEVFLFVFPAQKVTPTARGLAIFLGIIKIDDDSLLKADILHKITFKIFDKLEEEAATPYGDILRARLAILEKNQWSWSNSLKEILYYDDIISQPIDEEIRKSLEIWHSLPEWEAKPPEIQEHHHIITEEETIEHLRRNLSTTSEIRPQQEKFSSIIGNALISRKIPESPNVLLAEAGTGTGKTIGYLTPALLWANKNEHTLWISTYTKHLQRQIEEETIRLYPDKKERRRHIVIRKGRENYLCLLNFERNFENISKPEIAIPLIFLAHWAEKTDDGDLMGGDLPGWFREIFGYSFLASLADKRGECIHHKCPHHQRCFIEHTIKRASQAKIVIANHALIFAQNSWKQHLINVQLPQELREDSTYIPHYIFDEGHHIPNAADSAFSHKISGQEGAEMRRWILGVAKDKSSNKSPSKGLRNRLYEHVDSTTSLMEPLESFLSIAKLTLPSSNWRQHLYNKETNKISSSYEIFLHSLEKQLVLYCAPLTEKQKIRNISYHEECDLYPPIKSLQKAAHNLHNDFSKMLHSLKKLIEVTPKELRNNEDLVTILKSLYHRIFFPLQGWQIMLEEIIHQSKEKTIPPLFIDFIKREILPYPISSEKEEKEKYYDISLNRHWLDPTRPFAQCFKQSAQSLIITSATLRDKIDGEKEEESWQRAERKLGIHYFLMPPKTTSFLSPFNYKEQTRLYIVTDIGHETIGLAHAFQALFKESHGGALGLFTAIKRLKDVYHLIYQNLEEAHIPLYAQHIDEMNNNTLVDILRTEKRSCLLGTDALRDGVDVPGNSLRMVVFERTPWARPDILHKARRRFLSDGAPRIYDDNIARTRLKQAFGRLIRRKDDYGVFVMLDKSTPTRLFSAFPKETTIKRLTLSETLKDIHNFFEGKEGFPSHLPPYC